MKLKYVIAVWAFGLFLCFLAHAVFGQTDPQGVPPHYRQRYNEINQWLDEKVLEWKPLTYESMSFCAHYLLVSEQMIGVTDARFDLPFLSMLKETGIDCVRLSIFPSNYEKYSLRYDTVIAKIRENNLKLMVAFMVGDSKKGAVSSFEQYKKIELDFTEKFIKRYNPEYYALVTEPITMEKRLKLGARLPDSQWVALVEETAAMVKTINPSIKTIAAVNTEPGQLELAKKFSDVADLDIVAFQLYGPAGLYDAYKGWVGKGDVVGEAIAHVQKKGKNAWITETWLSIPTVETWQGSKDSNSYFNEPWMAPLDAKWLRAITYYAQKYKVKSISPFFTGKFISYPTSDRNQQRRNFLRDLTENKRTAPFYAYQDVIKEVRGGAVSGRAQHTPPLSGVKVASLYDNITDGVKYGRGLDDTVRLLKETKTDFVFRGFFKWIWPVFESPDEIPAKLIAASGADEQTVKNYSELLRRQGYYYGNLKKYISAIKESIPDLIFCGAIPAQCIGKLELNPITQRVYSLNDAWSMSFDPRKWNLRYNDSPVTKEQFQKWFYGIHPYGGTDAKEYDWRKAEAFFPDITNAEYQELLVSCAKEQIDCGADAIWIDGLPQETIFNSIFKEGAQSMVKDLSIAAANIVDAIHEYGNSKGKNIYVGYWANPFGLIKDASYVPAKVDFVTISPSKEEVLAKKLDEYKWGNEVGSIRKIYGDIPIFAFIDWAFDDSQMVAFSQKLNKEEQSEVIEAFDKAYERMGVKFVYPLHGGYMGQGVATAKLSFGKDRIYDSLAPEFDTYEKIKALAKEKVN
jgi:hypothetical protein